MRRGWIATTLLLLLVPWVAAHTTPTSGDLAIMNQVAAPSTSYTSCTIDSVFIPVSTSSSYIIIAGMGQSSAGNPAISFGGNNSIPTQTDFRVSAAGVVDQIQGTAHLLGHHNVSIAGTGQAFWFVMEYTPPAGRGAVTYAAASINAGSRALIGDFTLSGTTDLIGNYTATGGCSPSGTHAIGRIFINDPAGFLPGTPVLSGSITGGTQIALSWPAVSNGPTSYTLTRIDPTGTSRASTLAAAAVSFSEVVAVPGAYRYSLVATNAAGSSSSSNTVTLTATSPPLFGDNGILYGQGRAALASSMGVGTTALDILYALFIILLLAGAGFTFYRGVGAGAGAFMGLAFVVAGGMLPLWVIVFFLACAVAAFLLYRRVAGGSGGGP